MDCAGRCAGMRRSVPLHVPLPCACTGSDERDVAKAKLGVGDTAASREDRSRHPAQKKEAFEAVEKA